jgi:DNA-binding NarL/FixJ family response regulator
VASNASGCGSILLADGEARTRRVGARLLRSSGFAVAEVGTGMETLELALGARPRLVVVEVELPDVSGYEVCRSLRDAYGPSLPILFVSRVRAEPYDRVAGLLVGADDYLVKPFTPDELVARIRALLRRAEAAVTDSGLTPRERDVLSLLAEGLRQTEIAARLAISPKTVASHIEHVLTKLGVHSRAEAVALAYRDGLLRTSG